MFSATWTSKTKNKYFTQQNPRSELQTKPKRGFILFFVFRALYYPKIKFFRFWILVFTDSCKAVDCFSICSGRCPHRPKKDFSLLAYGELVRRGRRTLRILPLAVHISRNAEDGVPYEEIALISGVFKRANAVRPYRVADDFCCFPGANTIGHRRSLSLICENPRYGLQTKPVTGINIIC